MLYDGHPFPGLVIDEAQGEVKVKCMYKVGLNRFMWPRTDDVIWYTMDQVVAVIPEPLHVTKRHVQVEPKLWEDILAKI